MKLKTLAKATLALGLLTTGCDDSRKSNCSRESKVG